MKNAGKSASVTFTNNQGYITSDKVILKSVKIADKTIDIDFSAEYTAAGSKVLIKDLKGNISISSHN